MRWDPSKPIVKHARKLQQRVASAIRSAAPRAPQRGRRAEGPTGGQFADAVARRGFLRVKRWGVVLPFDQLGDKFLWFTQGARRRHSTQPARRIALTPDETALRADVEADAARHFERRDKRAQRRRGRR